MSEQEKEAQAKRAAKAAEKKAAEDAAKKNSLIGQLGRLRAKRTRGISG